MPPDPSRRSVAHKLIASHLVSGAMVPGEPIELVVDQTLTQDTTGTMVMLECEALGIDRVRTQLSAQYVDHNLLQGDYKNPDNHLFLLSTCTKFGIWYSPPGSAPTATPAPPARSACWRSASAACRWRWPWPASPLR